MTKEIALAFARFISAVSIPQALAALDGLWNFDATYGGDPHRFAAVRKWRAALAAGGADAFDPALMLSAMCALCAGGLDRLPIARIDDAEWILIQKLESSILDCLDLAQELAELLDAANGTTVCAKFDAFAKATVAKHRAAVEACRAKEAGRLN